MLTITTRPKVPYVSNHAQSYGPRLAYTIVVPLEPLEERFCHDTRIRKGYISNACVSVAIRCMILLVAQQYGRHSVPVMICCSYRTVKNLHSMRKPFRCLCSCLLSQYSHSFALDNVLSRVVNLHTATLLRALLLGTQSVHFDTFEHVVPTKMGCYCTPILPFHNFGPTRYHVHNFSSQLSIVDFTGTTA